MGEEIQFYLLGLTNAPPYPDMRDPFYHKLYSLVERQLVEKKLTSSAPFIVSINYWIWLKNVRRIFDTLGMVKNLFPSSGGYTPSAFVNSDQEIIPVQICILEEEGLFNPFEVFARTTYRDHRAVLITPESIIREELWITGFPASQLQKIKVNQITRDNFFG